MTIEKKNNDTQDIDLKEENVSDQINDCLSSSRKKALKIMENEWLVMSDSLKELLEMEKSGKYVFHWSNRNIKKLEPRQAYNYKKWKNEKDWEPAVFATESAYVAIFRSLISNNYDVKNSRNIFWINGSKIHFACTANLLESARTRIGKIYILNKEDFTEFQWIQCRSYAPIRPIKMIEVGFGDLPENIKIIRP